MSKVAVEKITRHRNVWKLIVLSAVLGLVVVGLVMRGLMWTELSQAIGNVFLNVEGL